MDRNFMQVYDLGTLQSSVTLLWGEHISVPNFIETITQIRHLIGIFGKTFKSIQYEMQKNLESLQKRYEEVGVKDIDLRDLLFQEVAVCQTKATDAVLWLSRCLTCVQKTFHLLWNSWKDQKHFESLTPLTRQAYKSVFQTHHTWFAQQLFMTLSKYCPSFDRVIELLNTSVEETDEDQFSKIRNFELALNRFLRHLNNYYSVYSLESQIVINEELAHANRNHAIQ